MMILYFRVLQSFWEVNHLLSANLSTKLYFVACHHLDSSFDASSSLNTNKFADNRQPKSYFWPQHSSTVFTVQVLNK